jgi:hypothetical protein
VDIPLIPGVDGLPDDLQLSQRPRAHPQHPGRPTPQLLHAAPDWQRQISDPKHAHPSCFSLLYHRKALTGSFSTKFVNLEQFRLVLGPVILHIFYQGEFSTNSGGNLPLDKKIWR